MRLKFLYIADWKNLKEVEMTFDQDTFTSVLVGRNATAKSNLLEAIVVIFRDLDLAEPPAFTYRLHYVCRGRTVQIDADPNRKGSETVRIAVDGDRVSLQRFSRKGGGENLPSNVFVYYSGQSDRMLSHFQKHEDRFDRELRAGKDQPLRPLLYIKLLHSKFALLAFFWKEDLQQLEFLKEYLRIEDLDSVLFVLRRPHWFSPSRLRGGDARFWGAKGVVRDLLGRLYDGCLAPLGMKVHGSRGRSFDRLFLFLPTKAALQRFASSYSSGREFFKALDSMHVADLIDDVRARVIVRGVDDSLTFRELSEGEQQLLMVLGLLRFTREEESLILLDEPDTHLNPAWSLSYVQLIQKTVTETYSSHVVMATHDPMVVAGLHAAEVYLMRRSDAGEIEIRHPERDPIGMGVSGLLMSDVYGLRSDLDPETLTKLDLRRRLAIKNDLSSVEAEELQELNDWVQDQGFTRSDRDPLYRRFVDAMTQWEVSEGHQEGQPLTTEELEAQRAMALDIVKKLMSEQSTE